MGFLGIATDAGQEIINNAQNAALKRALLDQSTTDGIQSSQIYAPQTKILEGKQKMQCVLSMFFSMVWVLDLGYEPLKVTSNVRISSFVFPSKIFVWGA